MFFAADSKSADLFKISAIFIVFVFFVLFIIFVVTSANLWCLYNGEKNESNYSMFNTLMSKTGNKTETKIGGYDTNHSEHNTCNLVINDQIAKKYNLTPLEIESYSAETKPSTGLHYMDPKSNKQIQALLKSNKKDMFSILELLAKHVKFDSKGFIKTIVNKGWSLTDSDIYNIILSSHTTKPEYKGKYGGMVRSDVKSHESSQRDTSKSEQTYDSTRDTLHAKLYVGYLRKYVAEFTPTAYLDFGCGDCNKTELVGKMLGLDAKNIHGADVSSVDNLEQETSFLHYDITRNPAVNFKLIKGNKLDYPDGAFDLISAFMVLHHVKDLREACAELNRVLRAGGILILREHDAYNAIDYMLCDVEHAVYDLGYPNEKNAPRNPNFAKNYYAKYRNWLEWAELLAEFGFELIAREYDTFSIKKNIGPTRYMCLVFRKN